MDSLDHTTSVTLTDLDTRLATLGQWARFLIAHIEGSQISEIVFTFDGAGAVTGLVLDFELVHPGKGGSDDIVIASGRIQEIRNAEAMLFPLRTGPQGFLDALILKLRAVAGSAAGLDQALVSLRIKRHRLTTTVPGWMPE